MRLTLRTLLAYLDDTLDPAQTKQIGQKVAESDVARDLIDKIRKVARKRTLGVPSNSGADKLDANVVAAYLDNDLAAEKLAEVEEQALHSDVHLAEIVACHQLLTLILSEPAKVPPTARQRMYGLISGPEVDPGRTAPRVAAATLSEINLEDEDLNPLVSRRGGRTRLYAAAGLAAALLVAAWMTVRPHPVEPPASRGPLFAERATKPADDQKQPTKVAEPDKSAVKLVDPIKEPDKTAMPPVNPPAPPASAPDLTAERMASNDRREIGVFAPGNTILLEQPITDAKSWRWCAGSVLGATRLMSLPGLAAEVRLMNDSVALNMWGELPEFVSGQPLYESAVVVSLPPVGFAADIRMERGRVYLRATKPTGANVRLRFQDALFDIELPNDQTEVLAEVTSIHRGEAKGVAPIATGLIALTKGVAKVRINLGKAQELKSNPPSVARWTSATGPAATLDNLLAPLATWAKQPNLSKERLTEWTRLKTDVVGKQIDQKKDVGTALSELHSVCPNALFALSCLGAIDGLPTLLDELDNLTPDKRVAAAQALTQWLGHDSAAHDDQLIKLLENRGLNGPRAAIVLKLLHGPSEEDLNNPDTYADWIEWIKIESTTIRSLALWRLKEADPEFKPQTTSADSPDRQERLAGEWKKRIPMGKLPPGRKAS